MPTCQGRYAPPEAVALLLPQARTILKYALFYHGGRHLQKILNIATTGDFGTDTGDSVPGPLRFIRFRIPGGVTSKNERQRSADTSLFSTVLSAARVKVAPQRCLIGLLTKS